MGDARTRLSKNENIPWKLIEGQAILLDGEESELIRLNEVGSEIWNAIDGTRTADAIVDQFCRTFDVTQGKAQQDVQRFLQHLLRNELVAEGPNINLESMRHG